MKRTTKRAPKATSKSKSKSVDKDNDAGGAPKKPSAKSAAARVGKAPAGAEGVPAAVLAKAVAIGAQNAGSAPTLAGAQSGAPVRFSGSVSQSTAPEFSAGAAPAHLSGQKR
jgi:hypothetical protein